MPVEIHVARLLKLVHNVLHTLFRVEGSRFWDLGLGFRVEGLQKTDREMRVQMIDIDVNGYSDVQHDDNGTCEWWMSL